MPLSGVVDGLGEAISSATTSTPVLPEVAEKIGDKKRDECWGGCNRDSYVFAYPELPW